MNILALLRLRLGRALVSLGLGAPSAGGPPAPPPPPVRPLSGVRVEVLLSGPARVEVILDAPVRIEVTLDGPTRPGGPIA